MTLRVFEAFSGYGSQSIALKNIGIEFEVVGISEIDCDAIISYSAIKDFDNLNKEIDVSLEDMKRALIEKNIGWDFKNKKSNIERMKKDKIKQLYLADKIAKNFGDISLIDGSSVPDHDLFTYSFPCTDISVAGLGEGIVRKKTRSGLLYECERIIETKKPKYLLMENVKNLLSKKHRKQFNKWLEYLETLGYTNYWDILNSKHYGIPQNRERVFVVSILGEHKPYKFPEPKKLNLSITDLLEDCVEDKYYMSNVCIEKMKKYAPKTIEEGIAPTLTTELSHGTGKNVSPKLCRVIGEYRRITPRETFRLMGVSDIDIDKLQRVNISETQQYKMAGNSIVVNVLEEIFKSLFLD